MSNEIEIPTMTPRQARSITDRIKNRVGEVCELLYKAHRGQAWKALGHASWNDYVANEFHMSKQRSFQLLSFVEVRKTLADVDGIDLMPATERQARPLVLLPDEQQPIAWKAAVATAGGSQPTAEQVEASVQRLRASKVKPPKADSSDLSALKRWWRKSNRSERAAFCEFVEREAVTASKKSTVVDSTTSTKLPRYIPADGMQYAELAILNLEKIQPNDTQREAAAERLTVWIATNLRGSRNRTTN